MNDFTKSELVDLHYAIRFFWKNRSSYDLPSDEGEITHSHDLMEKLDSMIENYCEHAVNEVCLECCNVKCGNCGKAWRLPNE